MNKKDEEKLPKLDLKLDDLFEDEVTRPALKNWLGERKFPGVVKAIGGISRNKVMMAVIYVIDEPLVNYLQICDVTG